MLNRIEIRISGLGGQGVVLAGQILGRAAVYSGRNAVQTQTYGAEARGSVAKSEVIISDGKIGFPRIRKCDILIAMSQAALDRDFGDLKNNGILLVDHNHVENIPETKAKVFEVPATETSRREFRVNTYANIIMLGALTKITNLVKSEAMEKAVRESVPEKTVEDNLNALERGSILKLDQIRP